MILFGNELLHFDCENFWSVFGHLELEYFARDAENAHFGLRLSYLLLEEDLKAGHFPAVAVFTLSSALGVKKII